MHHLGAADELERHQPQRQVDVVVAHGGVDLAVDGRQRELVHGVDPLYWGAADAVRPGQVARVQQPTIPPRTRAFQRLERQPQTISRCTE